MHALLTVLTTQSGVVTGTFTLLGTLSTFALTQWFTARQQARSRRREDDAKITAMVAEVVSAVIDMQTALVLKRPRWITWKPWSLTMAMAYLEFVAGLDAAGFAHGVVQGARVMMDWHYRYSAAAEAPLREPSSRLFAAVSRAVLLPDRDIADAAMRVADAVPGVMIAAAVDDGLSRHRAVEAQLVEAERALQDALGALVQATQARLHPSAHAVVAPCCSAARPTHCCDGADRPGGPRLARWRSGWRTSGVGV